MLDSERLQDWSQELEMFWDNQVGPKFKRLEARERGLKYVKGVLSETKRKNGWQVAETEGELTPDGM